jgi:hypothetical protein
LVEVAIAARISPEPSLTLAPDPEPVDTDRLGV